MNWFRVTPTLFFCWAKESAKNTGLLDGEHWTAWWTPTSPLMHYTPSLLDVVFKRLFPSINFQCGMGWTIYEKSPQSMQNQCGTDNLWEISTKYAKWRLEPWVTYSTRDSETIWLGTCFVKNFKTIYIINSGFYLFIFIIVDMKIIQVMQYLLKLKK